MLQGSFWTAFGARFGTSASSGLDEILERDHFILEDLLDHDDVIQECKYMNAQLVEFLSSKASIEKLVRYVITLPGDEQIAPETKDDTSMDTSSTTPSSASASSTSTSAAASSDSSASMEITDTADHEHHLQPISEDSTMTADNATANSTDSTSAKSTDESDAESKEESSASAASVEPHLRPNFHKYPYVASELFACEVVSMLDVLFEHQELLDLLFSFLSHPAPMDPSHASYFRKVMVVLIQRKYEALVRYIQSHGIIDRLVTHIGLYSIMEILIMIGWDDGLGQVNDVEWLYKEQLIPKLVAKLTPQYETATDVHMNAARALVDVVVKCPPSTQNLLISHLQSKEVLDEIFRHMFSGSLSSLTNSMSIIIVLVQRYANRRVESGDNGDKQHERSDSFDGENSAAGNAAAATPSADSDALEEPFSSLAPHLHKIIALLHQPQPEVRVQFGKSQPFGETRMKVVELTLVLLRSRLAGVDAQLSELRVLALMLESFFLYPWNNMLHGLVESIVRTVLDSDSDVLRHALFVDGELVDRFVSAYERSEKEAKEKGGYRLGYMGHLLRTSMAIEDQARKSDDARKQLLGDNAERWNAFVADQLEKENEKQKVVAPFVGGEEDILDGLQFDIAGMSTDVNPYLSGDGRSAAGGGASGGGGDDYSFNEGDDEEGERGRDRSGGGSVGYDYTHSYTIRDPDVEYEENGNEADDGWRTATAANSFASGDDWGSFQPTFADENKNGAAAASGEFDRGTANSSGRQIIEFGGGGGGERAHEEDDFGTAAAADDPFRAAEAKGSGGEGAGGAAWPPSQFNAQFDDADFDADFEATPVANADATAAVNASAVAQSDAAGDGKDKPHSAAGTESARTMDDFDAEFPSS